MAQIPPGTDLSQVPMGPNPSGAPPDFEHGASLIGGVQGVGISLAAVTTAFLITRLRVYVKLNRGLVLDDGKARQMYIEDLERLTSRSLPPDRLRDGTLLHRPSKHFGTTL